MPTTREYDNLNMLIFNTFEVNCNMFKGWKGKTLQLIYTLKWTKANRNPTGLLRIISWSLTSKEMENTNNKRKTQTELFWTICVQIERKRIRLKRVPSSSVSFPSLSLPPSPSLPLPLALTLFPSLFLSLSLSFPPSSPPKLSLSLSPPLPRSPPLSLSLSLSLPSLPPSLSCACDCWSKTVQIACRLIFIKTARCSYFYLSLWVRPPLVWLTREGGVSLRPLWSRPALRQGWHVKGHHTAAQLVSVGSVSLSPLPSPGRGVLVPCAFT